MDDDVYYRYLSFPSNRKLIYMIVHKFMMAMLDMLQVAFRTAGSLTDVVVETHRRKHLAYLMADQGALVNPESSRNLPKQVCCSIYEENSFEN